MKRIFLLLFLFLGIIMLVGSIWSFLFVKSLVDKGTLAAKKLDGMSYGGGEGLPPDPCRKKPPILSMEVIPAQRVMSENETQALTVSFSNHDKIQTCNEKVELQALGFDFSPSTPTQRELLILPGEKRSFSWILMPKKLGTFTVGVLAIPYLIMPNVGITVTNVFGLTIWQAKLLSSTGTFLGMFFAPVLTFKWWYTAWKKHKRNKSTAASSSSTRLSIKPIVARKPNVPKKLR